MDSAAPSAGYSSSAGARRFRRLALVLLAALLHVPAGPVASEAARGRAIVLEQCLLSGVNFPEKNEGHVAGYVPHGHALGTYGGTHVITIWVFSCDAATAGGRLGPAEISFVGVLLDPPDRDLQDPTTWPNALSPALDAADRQFPANWPQYVAWAHSDNPRLADALRDIGMPAETVPGIAFREQHELRPPEQRVDVPDVDTCSRIGPLPGLGHSPPDDVRAPEPRKTTKVSVPWKGSSYRTSTVLPTGPHNMVTHCHDQLFWHGSGDDAAAVRLTIHAARDHFCNHQQPACGRAEAQPGSAVADFLEGAVRDDPLLAFDHERISRVTIEPHRR